MKGTGAKRNVCPGSCVSTGAKFPVAPVESAPMQLRVFRLWNGTRCGRKYQYALLCAITVWKTDLQTTVHRRMEMECVWPLRQLLICCIFRARLSFVAALRYQTVEIIVPHWRFSTLDLIRIPGTSLYSLQLDPLLPSTHISYQPPTTAVK